MCHARGNPSHGAAVLGPAQCIFPFSYLLGVGFQKMLCSVTIGPRREENRSDPSGLACTGGLQLHGPPSCPSNTRCCSHLHVCTRFSFLTVFSVFGSCPRCHLPREATTAWPFWGALPGLLCVLSFTEPIAICSLFPRLLCFLPGR